MTRFVISLIMITLAAATVFAKKPENVISTSEPVPAATVPLRVQAAEVTATVTATAAAAPRENVPQPAQRKQNDSGAKHAFALFQKIAQAKPEENVVYSPFSLSQAMYLAYLGAAGGTSKEIDDFFAFHDIAKETRQMLPYKSANAVWFQSDYNVSRNYCDAVAHKGKANIRDLESIDAVNGWVKENTNGKIENILEKLDAETKMVLTNAVYFKDMWQTPFSKTETKPQEFHCIDGKKVQVPMMRQKAGFRYTSQKDYACIELPYATAGFSMFVILPNEQVDFKPFVQQIDEQNFSAMINSLQKIEVSLQLPKFKMESDYGLVPMLQKCGVKQPFENIADFSLINKAKDIHIDDIRQKAVIEVDEEGTEAAAATAVTMSRAVLQPPPVVFIAERPFVYVLFDSVRNEIMFIGTKVK